MAILKQLEDEYEILEKLQENDAGTIHKVRHRQSNELRMVLARPRLRGDAGQQVRFLPEVHAVSRLGHPHVARVFDASVDADGVARVVVELIPGMALSELSARAQTSPAAPFGRTPPLALTLEIARQGLRGLAHLHDHRVVHGDVSPENLMLTRDPHGRPQVKLIALGIAGDPGGGSSTGGGAPVLIGKLRYAAPETFDDEGKDDPRGDLYSFALVVYELLTGRFPISGESASSLIAGHLFRPPLDFTESDPRGRVPDQVRRAVMKALAKTPSERFADAVSFVEALGTGAVQDLTAPGVLEILEQAGDEDRRAGRVGRVSDLEDAPTRILRPSPAVESGPPVGSDSEIAPTRILRPSPAAEPRQESDSDDAPTRILRPSPAPAAETRRLGVEQMRSMQAEELAARAYDRVQAGDLAQARDLLGKALGLAPDHRRAAALLATIETAGIASGREAPAAANAETSLLSEQIETEQPTERLDDDGILRALRTEAAAAQGQTASEESTTVIRDPASPTSSHDRGAAPAVAPPVAEVAVPMPASEEMPGPPAPSLDETLHTIRALRDDGRAGEALERLNRAVREYGPQPTLNTLRDELGEALLERDVAEEESASQMFEIEPSGDVEPAAPSGEAALGAGKPRDLAEASIRGLSDATIRSFEGPPQQVRDRPDPPTAHPTRNMVAVGLMLVVVFAALVFLITRGGPAGERPTLEAEDVAAADLSPGSLALDAVPWAEIVALDNPALEEAPPISPSRFTPVILSLPPGDYRISLRYPPTGQSQELAVHVESDVRVEERVTFESLDAQAYFERVGW